MRRSSPELVDVEEAHRAVPGHEHTYPAEEGAAFRRDLLAWFAKNARDLPWRAQPREDANKRAYGIWVSEVMLQQTRVATVIEYWKRWMGRWPTVAALAAAPLEEVNEAWAGLGYYRRAALLLEGAKHVMSKLDGRLPQTPEELREIPGIGPYTAGAIASIAFDKPAPLVDGNVIRVFARHRAVLASPKHSAFVKHCWSLAASVVDAARPGAFNEALMELGATVCTPAAPLCPQCPVRASCRGLALYSAGPPPPPERAACALCDASAARPASVAGLPLKAVKAAPRPMRTVCVIAELPHPSNADQTLYLLQQRPPSGLLANLWEFPGTSQDPPAAEPDAATLAASLLAPLRLPPSTQLTALGETFHQFSHISQDIYPFLASLPAGSIDVSTYTESSMRWLTRSGIAAAAVSKGVHKCLELLDQHRGGGERKRPLKGAAKAATEKRSKKEAPSAADAKKQRSLDAFLPPRKKAAKEAEAEADEAIVVSD